MPPKGTEPSGSASAGAAMTEGQSFQLPWAAIPKFIPGTTDVTEYSKKLEFLAAMWPRESLHLLAPRAALQCEGSAFKKVAGLAPEKLKANDESGVKLLVDTLGGSWGRTVIEQKYDTFEKAIFGTVQKADETNDSYLARHDIHFEELLAQGVSFEEVRAYILLRQSSLTAEDRKRIVVELDGKLSYKKVCASVRLLGSRFFADLQGQRGTLKTKTYDANMVEDAQTEEPERAFQASAPLPAEEPEWELDSEYVEAMVAVEDQDALAIQAFEEELEGFFQETPELQEALVSYLEARSRLLAKRKARGFWPIQGSKGSKGNKGFKGKGKGKSAKEQLLQRIAKSHCRACGERGHWKAECPKFGKPGSKSEATTSVAQASVATTGDLLGDEIHSELPTEAIPLAEALCTFAHASPATPSLVKDNLLRLVRNLKCKRSPPEPASRPRSAGTTCWTEAQHRRAKPDNEECNYLPDVALTASTRVEAILDTGASRCVVGSALLPQLLSQLNSRVRSQIRVSKSSVKFRFGNNQTLTSDKRVLFPIRTVGCQILWLGVEVVPGRTPLLFSKKAIKQLGGVLDTTRDVCLFKRLRKQVSLQTGATGLYLLDLARLCEESCSEMPIQCASEDSSESAHPSSPCMKLGSLPSEICTEPQQSTPMCQGSNSIDISCRKYPEHVNVLSSGVCDSEDKGIFQPPVEPIVQDVSPHTPAVTAEATTPVIATSPLTCDHGRRSSLRRPFEPRQSFRSSFRRHSELHDGRGGGDESAGARSADRHLWNEGARSSFRGRPRDRSCLGEVVPGAPFRKHQACPQGVPPLCGARRGASRGHRDRVDRATVRSQPQERPRAEDWTQEPSCSSSESSSRCRGRSLGHDQRIQCGSTGRSEHPDRAHEPHGKHDAADRPASECCDEPPERLLREVEACRDELSALISSGTCKPGTLKVEGIEPAAKELLENKGDVSECKRLLRKIPWSLLKEPRPSSRTITESSQGDHTRPGAYVMFGMFVHGGVVGKTQVTQRFPWLTKLLAQVIQLTQPEHSFTTIAVSCNTSVEPHRDSYNSKVLPNLVIPLDFPKAGGEIWVAKPPEGQQRVCTRECNGNKIEGSLQSQSLTMPWTGDRTLVVAFSLQAAGKLTIPDRKYLEDLGFPISKVIKSQDSVIASSKDVSASPQSQVSTLRQELMLAQPCMQESDVLPASLEAAHACVDAFCRAQTATWDVFQDSLLTYQQNLEPQLDVLEISAHPDSLLTRVVIDAGGKAKRFPGSPSELTSVECQRELWDLLQRTRPKHVWLSPDAKLWSAWSCLNAARNSRFQHQLLQGRQSQQTLFQLFVRIFEWQKQQGHDFHFEQPANSQMLKEVSLQPILQNAYRVNVDLCSFGLKTPLSQRPIRKATQVVSTNEAFIQSLRSQQCPGHSHHQPVAGKLRELKGASVSQYAGTFCRGFAEHCAKHLLPNPREQALALEGLLPLTRKRFKTSSGVGQAVSTLPSQKRAADDNAQECSQRDQVRRRLDDPLQQPVHEITDLSVPVWEPIFQSAQSCATKATPSLVPPQHNVIAAISQALPQYQVLQVFAALGGRSLHHPLGALPSPVAPWRITLCSRRDSQGNMMYQCVGTDDRTTMPSERRRQRIAPTSFMLTVFAQKMVTANPGASNAESTSVQSDRTTAPDLEGWGPPPVPLHGPAFRSLTREDKTRLRRIHNNLGHPAPETLSRHLKAAGEKPALVDAALDFQCDVCLESTEPRHQRPGKLPEPRDFNDVTGVDGFFFKSKSGYRTYILHVLDEASCFQQARRTPSRLGQQAAQVLNDMWISWAGPPKQVYLDPAGEFRSEQILDFFQQMNTRTWVTAAAWQRGRLERHGDILKDMLARLDIESPIVNDTALDQALQQVVLAKNSLIRHGGFSPEQIVFGKSLRVPGSVSSDEEAPAHALSEGTDLESEMFQQKLELRCRARRAFMDADNSQAIRRASLRRSNPSRGPFVAGMWVLYWVKKSSPNRLAAGRWHGPAKVICSEGKSVIWLAHGTNIIRAAPENLRPASLREWQHLSDGQLEEPLRNVGGASTFLDLTGSPRQEPTESVRAASLPPVPETAVLMPQPGASTVVEPAPNSSVDEVPQPEQELMPQVSQEASGVERDPLLGTAAPSDSVLDSAPPETTLQPQDIPVPESEDGLASDHLFVALEESGITDERGCELIHFTTVEASPESVGPPLAEDNLPYVLEPLQLDEHQAFCLEVPLKVKDMKHWMREGTSEHLATVAAASKRARAEVCVKDLTRAEQELFEKAKAKEISCWLQTSAIRATLRRKLNPDQILKSRWILTWKAPEEGEHQRRAKARLVVLGFQDPKLVEVARDAPTLSREGRALVLQTVASKKFRLGSFDIKTAFLRGKADASNPLAMEPPKEMRQALNLKDDEVCELLGNAYGRVDAPLLFYKELSKQLLSLGFTRHPLEPCVFLLYSQDHLHGILGMHVDDGVCGGDKVFAQKVEALEKHLPFGSRKHDRFTFTGIFLEQLADYTIRASQSDYVRNIPQLDIGRGRRQTPEAEINEAERSKLRGLVGSLQYAVTHTRPDMAAKLGEIQSSIPKATVQTLLSANKVLREAQEQHQVYISYLPIGVERLTFVSFGDASFASSKSLSSHQGALICATDERLLANQEAPLSPLSWSSKKIPRVVRSTLSAEAYAMSKAVDMLGWMRALWGVVHIAGFKWQQPLQGYRQLNRAAIITDCKSLFDLVTRLAMPSCEEFRTTLEVLLIKERCSENTTFRWVPTTLQAADCLTKPMDSSVLRTILAQGRFKLYDASQDLDKNAQRRQAIEWLAKTPPESLV